MNSDNISTFTTADITKALRAWEQRYEVSADKARRAGATNHNKSARTRALHMVMFLRSELTDRVRRAA